MNTNVIICYSRCARPLVIRPEPPGSVVAHEVRNPLCNIDLAADMLKETNLDEEQRKYLDIIVRASGRVDKFIDKLLNKAEEMQYESYSLRQLLEEVLVRVNDRLLLKQVVVFRE